MSDIHLARAVADGAASAPACEGELARRFAPRIRLFGLRHLGNEHDAADLVQRVLVVVLEKLRRGEVRDTAQIASFVLGTARVTAHGIRRSSRRDERLARAMEAGSAAPDPIGLAQDVIAPAHLARCLEALAERERTVLVMTYFDDSPSREIARALDLAEGHVRVLRHRALERVRRCMQPDPSEAGATA